MPPSHHHLHTDGPVDPRRHNVQAHALHPVHFSYCLHLLPRPHCLGALPAHRPPDWMETTGEPVPRGSGRHLDRGLPDICAFPKVQCTYLAFPEPEPPHPRQRPPHLHGTVAVHSKAPRIHHLPACLPVPASSHPHLGLLPAHLPASEKEEGHGGARQECDSEEEQGLHKDQRHADLHCGGLRSLLASTQHLQHGV